MIKLTKINNEEFVINSEHIVTIEVIPESKVVLDNKEFYIVRESVDDIIQKIIDFNARVYKLHAELHVKNNANM